MGRIYHVRVSDGTGAIEQPSPGAQYPSSIDQSAQFVDGLPNVEGLRRGMIGVPE